MAEIRIDSSQLTFTQFYIPGTAAGVLDGASSVAMSLDPGTYGFQQQGGVVADFTFRVTATGTIDYDPSNDGFLSGRGTATLVVRGFPIVLDGTPLSHSILSTLFGGTVLAPDKTHPMTLVPAPSYGFISAGGVVADFTFAIRADGTIRIDPRFSRVAEVSGRTLKVKGSRVTLDTLALSHSLVPLLLGYAGANLPPGRHELTVLPGVTGYYFVSAGGVPTDFTLTFDSDGDVTVDPRFAGFAEARGRTLTLKGYTVTLDTRALSHGLVPLLLDWAGGHLLPGRHELTIVPGQYGYSFISAGGVVAAFTMMVKADGTVTIESEYTGFADVRARTVTLGGYRITLDTRALSHGLVPLLLDWAGGHLGPGVHDLTVLPGGAGYSFIPAGGIVADFALSFNTVGSVAIPPRYAGFAQASARTLTITGYKVSLDLRELTHDVFPQILDFAGGLLSPGVHELTMMPASGYTLVTPGSTHPPIPFNVDAAGITTLIDAPPGVTAMSGGRYCGVPDSVVTPLQVLTYGSSGGHWSRGNLSVSIDLTGGPTFGPALTAMQVIQNAFAQWQAVLPTFFRFNFVPSGGDIQVVFGSTELDPRFGADSGVRGTGQYPEAGRLSLDRHEAWTPVLLQAIVLHEIGHVLGLRHSDDPQSLMYPYVPGIVIDAETQNFLRNLYGWRPQIALADRATSDRPALAVTANTNFTSTTLTLRSAWKGSRDDQSVYESALENNVWTPQRLVPAVTSSHGPALTTIPLNNGTPSTGLLMAFKGAGDDQGIFTIRDGFSGWTARQRIPDVGTSRRPALANFNGMVYMAWKGARDDQGIYWSKLRPTGWDPQQIVRGVGTSEAPALAVLQNRLFMFWKGIEGDSRVYYTSREFGEDRIWAPQRLVEFADNDSKGSIFIQIGSSRGPSVTPHVNNRLLLTWKGIDGDQGVYFSFFDGTSFTGQIRVADVGTSEGPGVCRIGNFSHMLWKGVAGDNVIYWSTLPD